VERAPINRHPHAGTSIRTQLCGLHGAATFVDSRSTKLVKTKSKKRARKPYTAADIKLLRQHSKARTPVRKIAKLMKRSEGSLRQKAQTLKIGLGHQR
jgi:hypothetical protein